jgi:predicted kinase
MRILLLMRGSAGCGKSTWITQNNLEQYTLCPDKIRLMYQSPTLMVDGKIGIAQNNDRTVWKTLFDILEARMERGEFTVIDATNSKTSEINRYKQMCTTYRFRLICVDFTYIPIEQVKTQNKMRPEYKHVPDIAIENMYARFATQKIPSGVQVIKPDELDKIWLENWDVITDLEEQLINNIL